jgi:hypothetical protein
VIYVAVTYSTLSNALPAAGLVLVALYTAHSAGTLSHLGHKSGESARPAGVTTSLGFWFERSSTRW